jgi:hypothetical protein
MLRNIIFALDKVERDASYTTIKRAQGDVGRRERHTVMMRPALDPDAEEIPIRNPSTKASTTTATSSEIGNGGMGGMIGVVGSVYVGACCAVRSP